MGTLVRQGDVCGRSQGASPYYGSPAVKADIYNATGQCTQRKADSAPGCIQNFAPDIETSLGEEVTARKTGREVLFQVTTAKALSKALRRVNPVVPPRHKKRQTWEAERWSAVRLLKSLPRYRLPYPVTLVHHDKPDFQLTTAGHLTDIEAVEAVSQVEAHKSRVIGGLVASGSIPSPIQLWCFAIPQIQF